MQMEDFGESKTRNGYLRNIRTERPFITLLISGISIKDLGGHI